MHQHLMLSKDVTTFAWFQKRFEPTELGEIVNNLIVEFFPDIVDVKFTADMEGKLDEVEEGKEQWQKVIDAFYKPFEKELAKDRN